MQRFLPFCISTPIPALAPGDEAQGLWHPAPNHVHLQQLSLRPPRSLPIAFPTAGSESESSPCPACWVLTLQKPEYLECENHSACDSVLKAQAVKIHQRRPWSVSRFQAAAQTGLQFCVGVRESSIWKKITNSTSAELLFFPLPCGSGFQPLWALQAEEHEQKTRVKPPFCLEAAWYNINTKK